MAREGAACINRGYHIKYAAGPGRWLKHSLLCLIQCDAHDIPLEPTFLALIASSPCRLTACYSAVVLYCAVAQCPSCASWGAGVPFQDSARGPDRPENFPALIFLLDACRPIEIPPHLHPRAPGLDNLDSWCARRYPRPGASSVSLPSHRDPRPTRKKRRRSTVDRIAQDGSSRQASLPAITHVQNLGAGMQAGACCRTSWQLPTEPLGLCRSCRFHACCTLVRYTLCTHLLA